LSGFGGLRSATIRVEVLYFDGCPTYQAVEETLRGVLALVDAEAEVALMAVNTDEEAQSLRFPGSPTIKRTSEDASSRTFVDKGIKKGRGTRCAPTI
jgi:hypothetical protein